MKPKREELIEKAGKFFEEVKMPYASHLKFSEVMADFALKVLEEYDTPPVRENRTTEPVQNFDKLPEPFTVRALRKRGTNLWYRDSKRAKPTEGLSKVYPVDYNHAFVPYDAELVEIECRVIKTIEG